MNLNLKEKINLSYFNLLQISSEEFKDYISCQTEKKYFYWHLLNSLSEFKKYKIVADLKTIGVICMKQDLDKIIVDLFLGEEFRRQGKGTYLIIELKKLYRNLTFLVAINNKQSQAFFNSLKAVMISTNYFKNDFFITYQFK